MRHAASLTALSLVLVSSAASAQGTLHAGALPSASGANVDARARSVLRALGTPSSPATLVKVDEARFGDGDVIVRYEESWRGLPVIGTGASVRFDRSGATRLAVVDLAAAMPSSSTPKITAADAAKVARGLVPMAVTDADVHLVVWRTRGEARLAWVALPKVLAGLPTSPRIVVDAQSGDLIEARDLVVFLDQTSMYATNPVKSPTLASVTLPIAPDNSGNLTSAELLSFNCIDEKQVHDVAFSGIPISVHTCELRHTALRDVNGDFIFTPAADNAPGDAFSEVSMYYHASRAYQFFRGLQGDPTAQVVTDKPLRTISNLQLPPGLSKGNLQTAGDPNKPLDPFQNAFFSPAGGQLGAIFSTLYGFDAGAMWFGQGPKKDYSYDGDVIYHEFTHGVVDATLKLQSYHLDAYGVIDAPGAMNEGLADYFSSALTGDPDVGEYASGDIAPNLKAIRTLENTDTCLGTIVGEVHFDSTFFSGGLWETRKALSPSDQTKFDAALYKAMRTHAGDGNLGYEDLANLFLETLKTDLPSAVAGFTSVMTKRGVLPGCTRVFAYGGTPMNVPAAFGGPGFSAPGTQNFGQIKLAPGMLQVSVDVSNATAVHVKFSVPAPGSGGLFGSQGTPFTPVLLGKFGQALTWKANLSNDADVNVDAKGDADPTNQTYTVDIDVPDGSTSLFLQIASKGQNDGNYSDFTVTQDAKPEPPPTTPPATVTTTTCTCSMPGTGSSPPFALVVLGTLGVALGLRRRRR